MKKNFLLLLVVGSVGQIVASEGLLSPVAEVDTEVALVQLAPAAPAPSPDNVGDQLSALQLAASPSVEVDAAEVDAAEVDSTVVSEDEEIKA